MRRRSAAVAIALALGSATLSAGASAEPLPASLGAPGQAPPVDPGPPDLDHVPAASVAPAHAAIEDPVPALRADAATTGSAEVVVEVTGGDPVAEVARVLEGTEHTIGTVVDDVVAVTVDVEGLERLDGAPEVETIAEDVELRLHLSQSTDWIGADDAQSDGHDGSGRRVAVIDTGVDSSHPALAGAVDENLAACFRSSADDTERCPNGLAQQTGPGAAVPCVGLDCEHGTHVASIAAGRAGGGADAGVASGASIVPIQVFRGVAGGKPSTSGTDLLAALEYVRALDAAGTPIDAVNLSLGDGGSYPAGCDGAYGGYVGAKIRQLRAQGVVVVVSSGNDAYSDGISFPACSTGATAVAATARSSDTMWDGANTGPGVSLGAPGVAIVAAVPGGGTGTMTGTSMAAPHVTGAVAVLRARYGDRSVSWLEERLWSTGSTVTDRDNGLQLRRIDVAAALGLRSPRPVPPTEVLWGVTNRGRVYSAGWAQDLGDAPALPAGEVVVAGAGTRSGLGYWLVTNRGRVLAFGDAHHAGDMSATQLNQPVTAMAATRTGRGYWLLGGDGGIFTFGDAKFHGSTGNMRLNAPVTDLARTPTGAGYWLTATDGGVFSFGDAQFFGSTGDKTLNQPVVSIAAGPTRGYWLVALDGGVFAFRVPFHGSLPGVGIAETGYRVRSTAGGRGYYIATLQGGVHPFGQALNYGRATGFAPGELLVDVMIPGS